MAVDALRQKFIMDVASKAVDGYGGNDPDLARSLNLALLCIGITPDWPMTYGEANAIIKAANKLANRRGKIE